jgi:endonuclease/exonuclease/phosphatase family metal-dependent hydrolase
MSRKAKLVILGLLPFSMISGLLVLVPVLIASIAGSAGSATCGMGGVTSSSSQVTVATWNVCGAACGNWQERSQLAAAQISRQQPDILAVQEGGWGATKRGHTFSKLKAIGYKTSNNQEPFIGRYIFYRPEKVKALAAGSFGLGGTHGMAWTTFASVSTGDQFAVVDVHLTYPKGADGQRAAQMTKGMEKLAPKLNGLPTLWVGDFNSNKSRADDAPARIMKAAGYVDARDVATRADNADVNSARDRAPNAPVVRNGNQTDHIYVPKTGTAVSQWQQSFSAVKNRYQPPFITDHNMISATIAFGAAAEQPTGSPASPPTPAAGGAVPALGSSPAAPSATPAAVGKFDAEQVANAKTIIATGKQMDVPQRGQVIAVMTAMGESSLIVKDHGDKAGPDSRGLFQQRDSWGTLADRMDPTKSAELFYKALLAVQNWDTLAPTEAAHRTQRNADPNHYTKFWEDAKKLYVALEGGTVDDLTANTSAGCATGDLDQTGYSTGADCDFPGYTNPRSCTDALAAAAKISSESPCTSHLPGGTWRRWCLAFVAYAYGRSSAGYHTAMDMYRAMKSKGLINTSKEIPAGALVFFTASSDAGHVALYNGGGKAWSNDYVRSGCIDLTPMSQMGAGGRYLGWSPPAFPGSTDAKPASSARPWSDRSPASAFQLAA